MATEAEWQAALADLKAKRKAFLAAGEAYAEAEKLVDAMYMTPQARPVYHRPWSDLEIPDTSLAYVDANHPATGSCPGAECLDCGARDCPHGEPLHYHHDGCPACTRGDD